MENALPLDVATPFKSMEEDENHTYQALFGDRHNGERVVINPRSMLRMRVKQAEIAWTEFRFESKVQSHQSYNVWVQKIMAISENSAKIMKVGVTKALDCSRIFLITRDHQDIEFLISRRSIESHTFTTA